MYRIAVILAAARASGAVQSAPIEPQALAARLDALANAFRAQHGRSTLARSPQLAATASDFAAYMARTGRYGHQADGRTPEARAREHGYDDCVLAENIAYRYDSRGYAAEALAQDFASGWKHSPPHRRNMLDADVTEIGSGTARDASGRYYAVQMFGRPRSQAVRFTVTNKTAGRVTYRVDGKTYALAPRAHGAHERCRASTLALDGTAGAVHPGAGDRYAITRDRGALSLERVSR